MAKHKTLTQTFLLVLFITFTIASLSLINVVYTISPFAVLGQPTLITVNLGFVFFILALLALAAILKHD